MKNLISIVIPTFNSELFIADCLQSIKGQKDIIKEVIIIDKQSNDKTKSIADSYSDKMDIKFIIEEKDGVPIALNNGFQKAKGEFLCWLNSDDVYVSPNALSTALKAIIYYNHDFVLGHSVCLNEEGIVKKTLYAWEPDPNNYMGGNNIFTGSLLFRKNSWIQFGGFKEKYNIAFEYELLNYLIKYKTFGIVSSHIGGFRIRHDALSSKYSDILIKQKDEILGLNSQIYLDQVIARIKSHKKKQDLIDVINNCIRDKYYGLKWTELWDLNE